MAFMSRLDQLMGETVVRLGVDCPLTWTGSDQLSELGCRLFDGDTRDMATGWVRAAAHGAVRELNDFLSLGINPDRVCQGTTALREAIANSHCACVEALLNAGADVNDPSSGMSPFMQAVLTGQTAILSLMMALCRVEFNALDRKKGSCLLHSARAGNFSVTQLLLQRCDHALLHQSDNDKETVITCAAINGHKEYLQQLMPLMDFKEDIVKAAVRNDDAELRRLLEEDCNPKVKDFGGLTALHLCAMLDHRRCLDLIVEHKTSLNKWDATGRMPIVYAAACGNYYCLEKLIEKGAIVSWSTRRKETPLMLVAKNGFAEGAEIIIKALLYERHMFFKTKTVSWPVPRDPFMTSCHKDGTTEVDFLYCLEAFDVTDKTALIYACENGHLALVRMLLDAGSRIGNCSHLSRQTPLMVAATSGHVGVVKELVARGANTEVHDKNDYTALFHAAKNGQLPCVRALVQAGANICHSENVTHSALSIALDAGHVDCAEVLIREMPFSLLTFRDASGRNVMLYAARNGYVSVIKLLLSLGLKLNTRDNEGKTPLMYAAAGCSMQCIQFLVEEKRMPVNTRNKSGLNALGMAVSYNLPDPIIEYLIKSGSNPNSCNILSGWTPLILACEQSNDRHVRILLSAGANVVHTDRKGYSALAHAAMNGCFEAVKLILEAEKAQDLIVPDISHKKALLRAVNSNRVDIVRAFLTSGSFDWAWYPDLFKMRANARIILKCLVTSGISPGRFIGGEKPMYCSPLLYALATLNVGVLQYILSNLYFTNRDYQAILRDKTLTDGRDWARYPPVKDVIDSLRTTPLPLAAISFLAVSSALGAHCKLAPRASAVDQLEIPDVLKWKLAFRDPVSRLCNTEWHNIDPRPNTLCYFGDAQSFFLGCVQRPQPFRKLLHRCVKKKIDNTKCFCAGDGLSLGGTQLEQMQAALFSYFSPDD